MGQTNVAEYVEIYPVRKVLACESHFFIIEYAIREVGLVVLFFKDLFPPSVVNCQAIWYIRVEVADGKYIVGMVSVRRDNVGEKKVCFDVHIV